MPATVVIDQPAQVLGDQVTASALVDGVRVTAACWLSHLNTLPTPQAKRAYVAGLLKAAAQPPAPAALDLTGTVTL